MIRFFVLALLAVCAPAFAASAGVTSFAPYAYQSGASSFVVAAGSNGTPIALAARSVTTGTAGEFLIRDMFNAVGPAGNLPLQATRTVSGLGAARAILAQASKGYAPLAIGLAGYELMQAYNMRASASGVEQDPGVDQVTQTCTGYSVFGGPAPVHCLPAQQACDLRSSYVLAQQPGLKRGRLTGSGASLYCRQETSLDGGTTWNGYSADLFGNPVTKVNAKICEPVVDALTGASYTPGTMLNGKCITGRYDPVSLDSAASLLATAMTVAAVKDYVNSPASQAGPVPESKPMVITGPATQIGPPSTTTTTSPAGTKSETKTPTYTYNYAGDTVNYSTVNQTVTNITNNEGATETTTETKPEETPQKGDCELYPKSVGCLDMGEVPDEEVPEEEREVDISPEDVDLPSGCPADVALPGGRTLSYASACAAAEDVAPLVIAAGVLSALLIAVAAIRGG